MKVVHLSWADIDGGAARAAWRVHRSLDLVGIDSAMFVGSRGSQGADVTEYRPTGGVILVDIHYSSTDETFYVGGPSRFSRYYQSNFLEELGTRLERDGWSGPVLIGGTYGPPVHAWDRNGYSGGDWIGARLVETPSTKT